MFPHLSCRSPERSHTNEGFTLVEVALSLGLVAFCLVALLGLFSTGLNQHRDSTKNVEAAHLMAQLLAERTAQDSTSDPSLALPPLNVPAATRSDEPAILLDGNGERTASLQDAVFGLSYRIAPALDTDPAVLQGHARVWVCLSWPAGAPATQSSGSYETIVFHRLK